MGSLSRSIRDGGASLVYLAELKARLPSAVCTLLVQLLALLAGNVAKRERVRLIRSGTPRRGSIRSPVTAPDLSFVVC